MNILTDNLPEGVFIDNEFYRVNTGFKIWIKIDTLISEGRDSILKNIPLMLALCYKELPPAIDGALKGLGEFYAGGKKADKRIRKKKEIPCYSFLHDADLIYAAFLSQYGIDLVENDLHWWQFLSLLSGLGDEHKFCRVVGYRAMSLSDIKDPSKKAFYRKMKSIYRLPDSRTSDRSASEIAQSISALF